MPRAAVYQRRRLERSVAYQVVQQSLETWLARRSAGWLDAGAGVVWSVVWSTKSGLQAFCNYACYAHQVSANTEQKRSLY